MNYQLTRHLEVGFDAGSGPLDVGRGARYLALNALLGRRLVLAEADWDLLAPYEQPRPLGDSPFEQRAAQAGILWPVEDTEPEAPLVETFQELAPKLIKYRNGEPAATAIEQVEQLKELCTPLREFDSNHYLWRDPSRLFRVMMDHFSAYLQTEVNSSQVGPMSVEYARQTLGRPERNGDFAQQLCNLHTSLARCERIWERFPAPARFLVLGDDDLMGLALTRRPGYSVDVFEIDRSLVRFLKKRVGPEVRILSRDLRSGLPEEFCGLYDAVLADPPYSSEGMGWFIGCCAAGLKPSGRLYLSTYPGLLEDAEGLFATLKSNGLELKETSEFFNRYPFPEETYQITRKGLNELGFHRELVKTIMSVPYLYAHLYECEPSTNLV